MSDSPSRFEPASGRSSGPAIQDPPPVSSPPSVNSFPTDPIIRPELSELLSRPAAERAREYRYRFGQSVVFGLPVIVLQLWGQRLGGREAVGWAGAFQALLAGWVVYVAAAGMLFEGVLLLSHRRVTPDLVCAMVALGVYLLSAIRLLHVLLGPSEIRPVFHWVILILAAWSGARWWQFSRRVATATRGHDSR